MVAGDALDRLQTHGLNIKLKKIMLLLQSITFVWSLLYLMKS